jgi:membrane protein implicated in regulation of membrane protease activity
MGWLLPLYIGTAIFGVGITIADLLGAFSHFGAHHDVGGHDLTHDLTHGTTHHVEDSAGSAVAHDLQLRGGAMVRTVGALRSLVYFCLGFGPVGIFAMTQYHSAGATLLWSIPLGAVVMVGTRMLRRALSREISSDIHGSDLLLEKGVVTVTIGRGQMGKVRVTVGGTYVDWYARAKADRELPVGARVRVVDATDECVFVEEA